ncbi:rCG63631 [Rattus norvegicus]|uniref:RCG63631 n=1 Tax=Rattus norvegicus TaxID=10116 RepID=A6I0Y9_RAT|nr:rCG63631 [Rattus norvegicus]
MIVELPVGCEESVWLAGAEEEVREFKISLGYIGKPY